MKKSLVLAMAMALGVTASAYAANPFSDVPAGHWAYDSVAKLAAAGVVDGYADGAFDGDKLMTRYEMAQIVAKAMAKGANVDKLAAEFADELDTLGVRVAKLEKGADAVKITGQVRYSYKSSDIGDLEENSLRTRLWVNGQINDDWSYTAMLQNVQKFNNDKNEETDVRFKRVYLEGKLGGFDVVAGRWNEFFYNANVLDEFIDGVKLTYGEDVKLSVLAGKPTNDGFVALSDTADGDNGYLYAANLSTKVGVVDAAVNYFKADEACYNGVDFAKKEIYNINLGLDVAKNVRLGYDYMWGDHKYEERVSKDGWIARVDYKGAGEEAGSFGIHAQWFDQPVNAYLSPTTDATQFSGDYSGGYGGGYEGYNIGIDYTLAKNIQLCVNWYDTESKINNLEDEVIYTELYFSF
ncbi:MAG: S-layer homology domain-containing protein [Phascolarctobacterium sp.]|nr:S-layer homology domain-containing protein [Phascolarctobacterium sp.]